MSPKPKSTDRLEIMQGTLDLIILRTLRWAPMHGHGIAKFIERTSGETFRIDHGSLYPALQRLLQEGWVAAELPGRHGPDAGEALSKGQHAGRHYRRDAKWHWLEDFGKSDAGTLLRRRYC